MNALIKVNIFVGGSDFSGQRRVADGYHEEWLHTAARGLQVWKYECC